MRLIPRVVLAGGKAHPDLAAAMDTSVRALARFDGRSLLDIVLDALVGADPASPIFVVGNVPDSEIYSRLDDQGDFVSNIVAGVASASDAEWILITSADMPFLTAAVVSGFVRQGLGLAVAMGADLIYPVVPVGDCLARYPGIKRTAVKLREGEFTGGNMMLARPEFLLDRRVLLAQTYAARKNPFRLAAMLGPEIVTRLALSQLIYSGALDITCLEKSVCRLVGGSVAALVCGLPEIATDLDRPGDFEAAAKFSASRQSAGS